MQGGIDELVRTFFVQMSVTMPPIERFSLKKYRTQWVWPAWGNKHGVYFFEHLDKVVYVGRALRTTLRQRLSNQCEAFGDPKWDKIIADEATLVGVIPLPSEFWYHAASLEAYLIVTLKPPRSLRIS